MGRANLARIARTEVGGLLGCLCLRRTHSGFDGPGRMSKINRLADFAPRRSKHPAVCQRPWRMAASIDVSVGGGRLARRRATAAPIRVVRCSDASELGAWTRWETRLSRVYWQVPFRPSQGKTTSRPVLRQQGRSGPPWLTNRERERGHRCLFGKVARCWWIGRHWGGADRSRFAVGRWIDSGDSAPPNRPLRPEGAGLRTNTTGGAAGPPEGAFGTVTGRSR